MDATQLQLDLANTSTNLLVEQTATGTASGVTSGAVVAKGSTTATGGEAAGAAVDSDPSSVPNQSVTSTTTAKTSAVLSATGTTGHARMRPSTSDTGGARAAIAAPPSMCTGAFGTPLVTGLAGVERPCASSNVESSGGAATLTYTDPAGTAIDLASFGQGAVRLVPSPPLSARRTRASARALRRRLRARRSPPDHRRQQLRHAAVHRGSVRLRPGTRALVRHRYHRVGHSEEGTGALTPGFTRTGSIWVWTVDAAGTPAYSRDRPGAITTPRPSALSRPPGPGPSPRRR